MRSTSQSKEAIRSAPHTQQISRQFEALPTVKLERLSAALAEWLACDGRAYSRDEATELLDGLSRAVRFSSSHCPNVSVRHNWLMQNYPISLTPTEDEQWTATRKLSSWMRPAGVIVRPRDLRSGVR